MMLTRRSVGRLRRRSPPPRSLSGPDALAAPGRRRRARSAEGGQAVLDWEQVSIDTVYGAFGTPLVTPIPVGVPVLGFVSLAMLPRGQRSAHLGSSSESAAVAQAAHDVLARVLPGPGRRAPDAPSTRRMDAIGPGHARTKGGRIGADAARDMLASREDDGYLDGSIHYSKPTTAPYWQPSAATSPMSVGGPCSPPGSARSGTWSSRRSRSAVRTPSGRPRGPTTTRRSERVGSNNSTVRTPAPDGDGAVPQLDQRRQDPRRDDDPLPAAPIRRASSRRRASSP